MKYQSLLADIRSLIARDDLAAALNILRSLLENAPQLDEVLHQSGRFENIRKQIRTGIVGHKQTNVEQNQIRAALLELLTEIEAQGQQQTLRAEIERTISIANSKNVVAGSTISATTVSIGETHHHYPNKKIPRNLTNPPFDPPVFLGREEDLQAVHDRLFGGDNFLMLVNGQGGIGKTSFAAKYWKNYQQEYRHRAFFFVGNGIENALLGIAPTLGVTFPDTMPGRERLTRLLQHIAELERPCLIVLDNANDADELDAHYALLRSCSNCHLLITSRLPALRESATHPIGALPDALALQLFRRHYPQHRAEDDALFFSILRAVGSNTLVVELLAKNLRAINTNELFYPLQDLLADLQGQGLLRLSEQTPVQVDWQQLEKSTPEQIVSAMYDLSPLAPEALALLAAFAVLPAEDIAYEMLKTLLTPADARAFSQLLTDLYQKGWIEKNDLHGRPHYKCSPVVQEVVRNKHTQLLADCKGLIDQLNEKLKYESGSGHLLQATYEEAAVFARYAETVVQGVSVPDHNLGVLCERIASYFTTTGNLERALFFQEKDLSISQALLAAAPDNADFKNGLAIAYSKLGETQAALGDLPQALKYFEQYNQLEKELYQAFPQNVGFKNSLAISYEKIGETQAALGDLPQALKFFEQCNQLPKELHQAFPQNVGFKNSLAISCSKLGETQAALGDLPQALKYFEEMSKLFEDLHQAFPQNVGFKNGLAISYSKLGETQAALGDLRKALKYFERYNQLEKELHQAYPQNVGFKNGLAISYERLGKTQAALGDLPQALKFFEERSRLGKELHEAYPQNVEFKNGLAASFSKLGETHFALGNLDEALKFYENFNQTIKELHQAFPQNVGFKNGLAISYSKLGETQAALGDLLQTLKFFEQYNQLEKELHQAFPQNVGFKNSLAVSYENLGETQAALGDLPQALEYFEQYNQLKKELHQAFPQNVEFKNGLAISYEKLGSTHSKLGDLPQALKYFEQYNQLEKELHQAFPKNVGFKNGLAVSYSKLGETQAALGDLPQTLKYFEEMSKLFEELHQDYPQNVGFKNGLAISYSKLGETQAALGDLPQALKFFEEMSKLFEELHQAYPQNVGFKNGLAISYAKLAQYSRDHLNNKEKANRFFQLAEKLWMELVRDAPGYVQFQRFLEMVREALSDLE